MQRVGGRGGDGDDCVNLKGNRAAMARECMQTMGPVITTMAFSPSTQYYYTTHTQ